MTGPQRSACQKSPILLKVEFWEWSIKSNQNYAHYEVYFLWIFFAICKLQEKASKCFNVHNCFIVLSSLWIDTVYSVYCIVYYTVYTHIYTSIYTIYSIVYRHSIVFHKRGLSTQLLWSAGLFLKHLSGVSVYRFSKSKLELWKLIDSKEREVQ